MMSTRGPPSAPDLGSEAIKWLVKFDAGQDPERLWRQFRAWMDQSSAHLNTFLVAEAQWNITHAAGRALSAAASEKEHREFRETLYVELRACPHLFAK